MVTIRKGIDYYHVCYGTHFLRMFKTREEAEEYMNSIKHIKTFYHQDGTLIRDNDMEQSNCGTRIGE